MRKPWTEREDRIIATRFDYPDISLDELRTALRAIGSVRTIKGIESRLCALRRQREAESRAPAGWLADPFLTKRRTAA